MPTSSTRATVLRDIDPVVVGRFDLLRPKRPPSVREGFDRSRDDFGRMVLWCELVGEGKVEGEGEVEDAEIVLDL
jgi:hypothetical protein